MNILTVSRLFTFVREGMMYVEFNSVTLFSVLYSRFLNYAKDVSKVTAQPTILEYRNKRGEICSCYILFYHNLYYMLQMSME